MITVGKATSTPAKKATGTTSVTKLPTLAEVQPLLIKNTCAACHNATKRQVGPAFTEVATRHYSITQLIKLIRNPQPQNWPGIATPMPPMPQVSQADVVKIATWIKSLEK